MDYLADYVLKMLEFQFWELLLFVNISINIINWKLLTTFISARDLSQLMQVKHFLQKYNK